MDAILYEVESRAYTTPALRASFGNPARSLDITIDNDGFVEVEVFERFGLDRKWRFSPSSVEVELDERGERLEVLDDDKRISFVVLDDVLWLEAFDEKDGYVSDEDVYLGNTTWHEVNREFRDFAENFQNANSTKRTKDA